jgi:toxin CptA
MQAMISTPAFLLAALAVAVMGFAIQRGATCTVAAVDEVIARRSVRRLAAMVEASLWVAGGLVLAQAIGALPMAPGAYAVSAWTVGGAALLGFGAWVNRACVFGAIARFGSGEWAYAMTPVGYLAGCLSVNVLFAPPPPQPLGGASPVLAAAVWLVLPFIGFASWRLMRAWRSLPDDARDAPARRLWTPHAATSVIGVTFLASWLLAGGAWPYTELLYDVARGMAESVPARVLLFVALWGGSLVGGRTAGRWRGTRATAPQLLRCFAGGALMAWGTLLIPGANDGLILVGMPLLRPYAWLAFATMCATIAAAVVASRVLARPAAAAS